ncbi:preprotein translocase subunit YajC [Actinomycetospora straminea]|uniref:Preprotein translocase subunit YajC n=1 Tax=Actinomycetospora straminea TaxID=663607 RepID=A0ABP9DVW3_9PSEU|nr:preprotein translocase subunit YajC [Actinomycetospora straminea]MDD7934279.1 preprotein translocase subunit YajC [Actinomycetospora straminea]
MDLIFPLLILFMIGLVFMSSRQRKKQENQQKSLQNSLHVGDVVVMTSGISGTVVDVDDERTIDLEIAPDVVTTWLRAAVREKLVAEEAVVDGDTADADADAHAHALPESSVPTASTPVVDPAPTASTTDTKDAPGVTADAKTDTTDNVSSPRSS